MAKKVKDTVEGKSDTTTSTATNQTVPPTDTVVIGSTEKKPDMVEVKKEDLENMLSRLDKYQKDIDLLFKAADKGRVAKALNVDGKVLVHTVKISRWDDTDKYVVGWKMLTNRAEVVMGKYIEDQTTMVVFNEGDPVTVPLLEFYRKIIKKDEAEIVAKETRTDMNGSQMELLKVRFPNGKMLEINSKFIN